MLSFEKQNTQSIQSLHGLDFVRLIREPQSEKQHYKTRLPEKPEPPKQKPPPPKFQQLQISKPVIDSIALPVPRLQSALNLNDALYLGGFHKNAAPQQGVQFDEEVVPLVRIAPLYPSRAARMGIEGWVKMAVLINSQGVVEQVKVLQAQPENVFNHAAIKAMKRWRFRPKIVAGKAVARTAVQQMNFQLH